MLPKPLDLIGVWEVGLAEIQYPRSWYTLLKNTPFSISEGTNKWIFQLHRGYYKDIPDLLNNMNDTIKQAIDLQETWLAYDPVMGKVRFTGPENYLFSAGAELAHILGAPPDVPVRKIPHAADLTGGFSSLYVYTDIIEHQIVGDHAVPLLRCIPVKGETYECVTITYDKPHYVLMSKNHINTITIEIKTDQNQPVPFTLGKVVVRLHIRPRKGCV